MLSPPKPYPGNVAGLKNIFAAFALSSGVPFLQLPKIELLGDAIILGQLRGYIPQ